MAGPENLKPDILNNLKAKITIPGLNISRPPGTKIQTLAAAFRNRKRMILPRQKDASGIKDWSKRVLRVRISDLYRISDVAEEMLSARICFTSGSTDAGV